MYYSPFLDIKVGSRRSTVQTICLVNQVDIDKYGLSLCLKKIMLELENLLLLTKCCFNNILKVSDSQVESWKVI